MPDFRLSVQLYSPDIQVSRHLYIIMTTLFALSYCERNHFENPTAYCFSHLHRVLLDSVKGRNRFSIDYCNRPTVSGDQHSASTLLQPFQRIRRRMPVCVCCRTGNNSQFRSDDFQKLCSCRISGTVMSSFQEVHIFKTPILYQFSSVTIPISPVKAL